MKWNRYDIFLIALISSLAFGSIGGFLTLSRAMSIALSPVFFCLFLEKKCRRVYFFAFFFIVWYLYGAFSLVWTSDLEEAGKEMFYYPVHFLFFLEIVLFSYYAVNPLKSLAIGWVAGFLGTSIVASWELITDKHLWMTTQKSNLMVNAGGGIVFVHNFCSVTFMNYNTYVTYLCLAYPFLIYATRDINKIFAIYCWIVPFIFVGKNASRGGSISLAIVLILSYVIRNSLKKKSLIFLAVIVIMLFYIFAYTDFFEILFFRMESSDSSEVRVRVWESVLDLWFSTFFIGSGIGSIITSMRSFSSDVLISHNLFLEILVQYGFVIFFPVIIYIFVLFMKSLRMKDVVCKSIVVPVLIALPVITIIDSGYLLNPVTFAFFASLEVFAYNECCQHYC